MANIVRSITLALCALAGSLALPAFAEERQSSHAMPVTAEAAPPAQPALWKVSDEDTTIYLFGTVHVLPAGITWFEGKIAAAFAASDELVTEIGEADPAHVQGLVIQVAMLPEDQTLRALLSEEQKAAYEAALAQHGLPPTLFDRFEPWYAALGLSTLPLMKDGFTVETGVERLLEKEAGARSLPHHALETPEYQLSLFDTLPLDVQKRYLAEIIEQMPDIHEEVNSIVEAWRTGDAETLAKLMNIAESDPVLIETLLTGRNRAWAGWIEERLARPGTVFLAVGAGHLAGPGSVQEQLAAFGLETKRVQ